MKITFIKKNLFWVILYGIILIIGSQLLMYYSYKYLNKSIKQFIEIKIDSEKIIEITEHRYTPGKGTYKILKTTSNIKLPLFIESQENLEDSIEVNQVIIKKQNDKYFSIKSDNQTKEYTIRTLESQEKFMKIYLFGIAFLISIGGLLKYNIKIRK